MVYLYFVGYVSQHRDFDALQNYVDLYLSAQTVTRAQNNIG